MSIHQALIIDDDETSRMLAHTALRTLGVRQILEAEDGAQGLKIVECGNPLDLVLLDVLMPNCDGIEVLAGMRRSGYTGGVIVMSSNLQWLSVTELLARKQNINVWAALIKPMTPGAIAIAIEKGMTHHPASGGERNMAV